MSSQHYDFNKHLLFPYNPRTGKYEPRPYDTQNSRNQSLPSCSPCQGYHTSRPEVVRYYQDQDGSVVQEVSRSSQQTGSEYDSDKGRPSSLSRHHGRQGSADHSPTRRTVINLVEPLSSKPRRPSQASDRTYNP
jgi:hypothetical protein